MAAEAPLIDVQNVRDEERLLGGDVVWWALLLVVSVPVVLLGLALAPQIVGFLILSVGCIAGSIAFAQIALRLPYFTHRFMFSVLLVVLASVIIAGIAEVYSLTLPVQQASIDTMYKPPISGG